MPDVSVTVKSPLKPSNYSLSVDSEDFFGSIKQYLLALSPLLQPATAFDLLHNGVRASLENHVADLLGETQSNLDLEIELTNQTWRDVELQLERAREALGLGGVESTYLNAGPTRVAEIKPSTKKTKKLGEDELLEIADAAAAKHDIDVLAAYPNDSIPKPAARELQVSKWQNVTRDPRARMQGIIAFLKFRANDGKTWHFVASTRGYFNVPQLTDDVFALPAKTAAPASTLIQLIEQVSPATIGQARKLADKIKANPLACVAVPQVVSVAPWLVDKVPELGSGPCTQTLAPSVEAGGVREYNEDFQSTREIQTEPIGERITRERRLAQVSHEFAAAALDTATKIVEGGIKPLNPDEEPTSAHVYLSNGIFFTYGADFTEMYADFGGDLAARQAAKKDLRGVEQLLALDEPELCPVLTTIIDYMGRRLVAQAPVPGIFRETEEPMIVYGRSEDKEEVYNDEKVGRLMAKLGERLHLKPHPVTAKGIELYTSADVHGTRGTDGRIYAIDLTRLNVPDLLATSPGLNFLRPEAITSYFAAAESNGKKAPAPLNPDVWMSKDDFPESYAAELEEDIKAAKDVSKYLRDEIVPQLITSIIGGIGIDPFNGQHLTTLMHRAGVNMRLLGLVSRLARTQGLQSLTEVALEEAIARSLKRMLNQELVDADVVVAKDLIEGFVSKVRQQDPEVVAAIKSHLESHFGFTTLPDDWAAVHLPRLSLLRAVSHKLGLQWTTDLKLAAVNPMVQFVSPRSLLANEALEAGRRSLEAASQAKEASESRETSPTSSDENEKEKDGEGSLAAAENGAPDQDTPAKPSQGESESSSKDASLSDEEIETAFSEGFTLINEAVSIYSQVYGAAHANTARALNHAALLYLEYGSDSVKAIEFERRAITVAERVQGLDNHEVLVMYANLAYFERAAGNVATSLQLLERTLAIIDLLAWPGYLDLYSSLNSVAIMLQKSGKPKLQKASVQWFEKAIEAARKTPNGVKGTLWFEYAQSQINDLDFKGAVRSMEQSHNAFKATHGPDDHNTKETKKYLEQLLQVTIQNAHSKPLPTANKQQVKNGATSRPKKSKKNKSTAPRLGEQNLDEVLDYIMGDSKSAKPLKKKAVK